MDETSLRDLACNWLREHFPKRKYLLKPMVFHDVGMTLSQYILKRFKGDELMSIPSYNCLHIRPDIVAIVILSNNSGDRPAWIVGECKVDKVNAADLRQAKEYAHIAMSYEAYMFYEGIMSREVLRSLVKGGHRYYGINRWGKIVRKRLIFMRLVDCHFKRNNY